jgi:hypothetical protein
MGTIKEQLKKEIKIANRNLLNLKKELNWYNQNPTSLSRRAGYAKRILEEDIHLYTNRIKWLTDEVNTDEGEFKIQKISKSEIKLSDIGRKLLVKQVSSFIKEFEPDNKMKRIEIIDEGIDQTIAFHLNIVLNILTNLNSSLEKQKA